MNAVSKNTENREIEKQLPNRPPPDLIADTDRNKY